jgi:hypothetical protein
MQKEAFFMRKPFLVALTGLALAACSGGGDDAPPPPIDEPAECDLDADGEPYPGYPYDLAEFRATVWPALEAKCGTSGCHLSPSATNYNVFKGPDTPATCPDIQTFKELVVQLDYEIPSNSALIKKLNGEVTHAAPAFAADPILQTLTDFVNAANEEGGDGEQPELWDPAVFASTIQPILDANNCATAGCHLAPNGVLNFNLNPAPAAGSAELDANYKQMTGVKYLPQTAKTAEDTLLYDKMTDNHQPNTLSSTEQNDLSAWIQAGLDKVDDGAPPVICEDEGNFNLDVFEDEIRPMLEGDIDYNDINGGGVVRTGCARGPCHGDPSFAGSANKFYLKPGGSTEELIDSFRCFVNVDNPSNSQLLLCPLNLRGCRSGQRHPGEDIFEDVNDLNYQKLVSYIYAARAGNSPLDFAFFAKEINPIFSDVVCPDTNSVCADSGCHERQADGTADGGSNFPLIRDAFEDEELEFNFFSASNFVLFNFDDADQSSLNLYPTDEIADVDNNALATGDNHPGGQCFAADSVESLAIQKFAAGLRPNADGFLQDFLVAGVFPANDVVDEVAPFDQETVAPSIFDLSGQSTEFNEGRWDGLFSDVAEVNLFEAFAAAEGGQNQLAYAVAYMINTTGNPIRVVVTAASLENDLELFVENQTSIGRNGQNATVTVDLDPFEETKEATRILLKVHQDEVDQTFEFTMSFADDQDIPLTNDTEELVFVLSGQNGGI